MGKWVSLALSTLIVFGVIIHYNRRSLRRVSFGAFLGLLISLHVLVFSRLMQPVERWPYTWWMVIMPVEGFALGLLLTLLGFRPKHISTEKSTNRRLGSRTLRIDY